MVLSKMFDDRTIDVVLTNGSDLFIQLWMVRCDSLTGGRFEDEVIAAMAPSLALGATRFPMRRSVSLSDFVAVRRVLEHLCKITPDVLQWHFDAITALPPGAVTVASSPGCDVQAFRLGRLAWGIQFHIETTPAIVRSWATTDADATR